MAIHGATVDGDHDRQVLCRLRRQHRSHQDREQRHRHQEDQAHRCPAPLPPRARGPGEYHHRSGVDQGPARRLHDEGTRQGTLPADAGPRHQRRGPHLGRHKTERIYIVS